MVIQTWKIKTMEDLISFQIKISIFFFEWPLNIMIIKQIMTGSLGYRLSRVSIDRGALGCTSVNRNSSEGDPESLGQIDLPITLDTNCYTDPPMRLCLHVTLLGYKWTMFKTINHLIGGMLNFVGLPNTDQ